MINPRDEKSRENLEKIQKAKSKLLTEVSKINTFEQQDSDLTNKEQNKLKVRLAEKNQQYMDSNAATKKEISKHKKLIHKTERRLSDKNKKMMHMGAKKKQIEIELAEKQLAVKDLEHLLLQKDDTLRELRHQLGYGLNTETAHLNDKLIVLEQKLKEARLDLAKKDAVIELLQKPEFDYSQLVDFDIKNIKTRHVGYPEVAQIEELTFNVQNIIAEPLHNVVCDIVIENNNRRIELDNLPVKTILNSKEKIVKTISLYKHLRSKGVFRVTVWLRQKGQKVALVEQSKTINI